MCVRKRSNVTQRVNKCLCELVTNGLLSSSVQLLSTARLRFLIVAFYPHNDIVYVCVLVIMQKKDLVTVV